MTTTTDDPIEKLRAGLKDDDEAPEADAPKKARKKAVPPSFELKSIGAELPPPPKAKRKGGGEHRAELVDNLANIAADPGNWYVVGSYSTRGGAKTVYTAIMESKQAIPAGVYDVDHRPAIDDEGNRTGGSELIARFIGSDEDEANAFEEAAGGPYESAYNPPKAETAAAE